MLKLQPSAETIVSFRKPTLRTPLPSARSPISSLSDDLPTSKSPTPPPKPSPLPLLYIEQWKSLEAVRRGLLPSRYALVEAGKYRILMTDAPAPEELASYADLLMKYGVAHVVRVCEPTYGAATLIDKVPGLQFHEMPFEDGGVPSTKVIDVWLDLLESTFNIPSQPVSPGKAPSSSAASSPQELPASSASTNPSPPICVAVHCRAGLGRAPLLAAIALIELGMDPFEAVGRIRASRRGAISQRQLLFLQQYQRRPPKEVVSMASKRSGFSIMKSLSRKGSVGSLLGIGKRANM